MYNTILVRYGEIILKGNNRSYFEKKLISNIKLALEGEEVKIVFSQARIFVEPKDSSKINRIMKKIIKVFGVVSVSPAIKIASDLELIKETAIKLMEEKNTGKPAMLGGIMMKTKGKR
jgi:thiamine biosynthesis protein ThiI